MISLTKANYSLVLFTQGASNEIERDSLFNGVNQFYPRDALNRMQYMDVKKGNTVLAHEGYAYDAMNRITSVSYSPGTDSFSYYLDGELSTATLGNLGHNLTYNLDKAGNRTSVVDNNVSSPYTPNALNQYTTAAGNSVVNGPNHQIQTYAGVTYTYINDERLTSAATGSTVYSMAYDALGRCVKRTLTGGPTTYYVYDGDKPIVEYDSSGASVGVNVYGKGVDEVLERVAIGADGQWHTYYLHQNHEGSVTLLTDTSGNVLERYRYDVFGAPTIYAPNWISRSATLYDNRFLFTGREYNANFGFYEYRARAYHPSLGRFMSEDPKLFVRRAALAKAAGDWSFAAHPEEAEFNLFRYCGNDPIDFTDPTGEFVDTLADIGFIAYDLYKLVTDNEASHRADNWRALGLDVAATAVPGVTGAGAIYRGAKAIERTRESSRIITISSRASVEVEKDIAKSVARFEKHLEKYGQQRGATTGEVNRIERQLEAYRKILESRGVDATNVR